MRNIYSSKQGFSLMEMLVVLLIVAIVAAVSAPMITKKMVRGAGNSSPWVWIGLSGNIGYNIDNQNRTAIIGTSDAGNVNSKFLVKSTGTNPQIALAGQSGDLLRILWNNGTLWMSEHNMPAFVRGASVVTGTFINPSNINAASGAVAIGGTVSGMFPTAVGSSSSAGATAVAVGQGAEAVDSGVAVGCVAKVHQSGGVAIGRSAEAHEQGIAIGQNANTGAGGAHDGIAIGNNAKVNGGVDTIVIGCNTSVSAGQSVLLGHGASVGSGSVTVGHDASAGTSSIAIGAGSEANGTNSCAIGAGVKTSDSNVIVLGDNATTVRIPGNIVIAGNANIGSNTYISGDTYLGWKNSKAVTYWRNPNGGAMSSYGRGPSLRTGGLNKLEPHSISVGSGRGNIVNHNVVGLGTFISDLSLAVRNDDKWIEKQIGVLDREMKLDYAKTRGQIGSDRRLKNVGEAFKGGLAELKKIEIFNFNYKKDPEKVPHVGVMAQDLMKIFPEAVWKGDDGFYRIRMEDMFYAVINAIKELDEKITGNSNRIAELEKQNAEQQKMIDALIKKVEKLEKKAK